jgi:hypothetical protein
MSHLIADPELLNRLRAIREPVEFRDPNGNVLGRYTPAVPPVTPEEYARWEKLFDLEEAERVLATERGQGRPHEEVMRELKSLKSKG